MKRLAILILGLMVFNAAFACEGKTKGKSEYVFKDYPCCFVGIMLAGSIEFEQCDKFSPEVLDEAKDVVRGIVKVNNEKKNVVSKTKKAKLNKEYADLDAKLIELTGYSYGEMCDMHNRSIDESGIRALAK